MKFTNLYRRYGIFTGIFLLCFLINQPAALATIVGTSVNATGSIHLDDISFGDFTFGNNVSGIFKKTQGGSDTASTYNGAGVTAGSNPIPANFTQTNDGFGLSGTASEDTDGEEFGTGIDFNLDLLNSSVTDTYEITVKIDFSNAVFVTGDDAYSHSEFSISDTGGEVFFTDLFSDSVNGDEINGTPAGTFGASLSEAYTTFLIISLNPGDSEALTGVWTLEGGVFSSPGTAGATFFSDVTISSIRNTTTPNNPVPEPGTFLFLGFGLLGIARVSRHRNI